MHCTTTIRPARRRESGAIANLFRISSDGVADYIWGGYDCPGLTLYEIGSQRYARENTAFSYQNCTLAEVDGRIAGMVHGFGLPGTAAAAAGTPEPDPILRPYSELELPGSFYISALALYPEHRGRGLGSLLLRHAHLRAESEGYATASLICFEENRAALAFYRRQGYREIDRRAVVRHPLIRHGGDALLMALELPALAGRPAEQDNGQPPLEGAA